MNSIQIVNNLSQNHFHEVINMARSGDTFYIISPFLMESFDTVFCEFNNSSIKNIHLVTTLKSNDIDLLRKANALHSFCSLCVRNDIKFQIYIDNKLHGKIYAASKNGNFIGGIVSSANFTESGLNNNHEWGIQISDSCTIEKLIKEVFQVCSKPLNKTSISSIIKKVDDYFKTGPELIETNLQLSVDEFIDFDMRIPDKRYFLKPVGSTEAPFPTNRTLDSDIATLHFSKRKPQAVRVGDILICYAVGTTKLLGYFEVITAPVFSGNDQDRWPWIIQGKNLCPEYSDHWTEYNNTLSTVKDQFTANRPITYVGGNTLGSLNFGSDKVRLSTDFATHLIHTITKSIKNTFSPLNMSNLSPLVSEIAKVLAVQCVNSEYPIITYGALAKKLSKPINPRNLEQPLGELSDFCRQNDIPLLSVIVVNQETRIPGSGFFKYFFPNAKPTDWEKIYIEQLDSVTTYKHWNRLTK